MVEWNSGLHILSLNGVVEQWVTRLKSHGWSGAVGNTSEVSKGGVEQWVTRLKSQWWSGAVGSTSESKSQDASQS